MIFTGKNLATVGAALARAISDVNMEIGQCPDHVEYADDIEDLETERDGYERLLARVLNAREKEGRRGGPGQPTCDGCTCDQMGGKGTCPLYEA
jgi:hypothetical protein